MSLQSVAAVVAAIAGISVGATSSDGLVQINDPQRIEALNRVNRKNSTWLAGVNPFFENMTLDDAEPLLGTKMLHIADYMDKCLPDSAYDSDASLPTEFDARAQWPGLLHPIRDQKHCGSCWAFSATEVLGDRFSIATGKSSPALSPQELISCSDLNMGCNGGTTITAWLYFRMHGLVSDGCLPYASGNGTVPSCATSCRNGEDFTHSRVWASSSYAILGADHQKQEIMTHGPIQVAFFVYASFMSYKSGVYQPHLHDAFKGGHAVKMIGWGAEGDLPWWLVANSWGPNWGMDGYFKIKEGTCGIGLMGPPWAGLAATPASEALVV